MIVEADKAEYAPRETIRLRLRLPELHNGELADLSIAVVDQTITPRHRPSSIVGHLLISSELEGGLLCPEGYLDDNVAADSMLQGKKWGRYDLRKVVKGDIMAGGADCETSQVISGRVRTYFRRKPVAGAVVSLIAPQVGFAAATETDSEGRFAFPFIDYPEGTTFVLKATRHEGHENVELTVDEKSVQPLGKAVFTDVASWADDVHDEGDRRLARTADTSVERLKNDAIMLGNVEVEGTRRNSATKGNVYAQLADFSFGLQKIEEIGATCLHELLRHIPGVYQRDNKCYVRAASSIYGDTPAAIAIDGVIVDGDYDLDIIQMQDVARVDVFKTGSTLVWGSAGGSGVISITTKVGTYGDKSEERLNQKKVKPLGFQHQTDFFLLPGVRKTLYWNPSVRSDEVVFNAADSAGVCRVVVEGVTTEGRLIHEETNIVVKQ